MHLRIAAAIAALGVMAGCAKPVRMVVSSPPAADCRTPAPADSGTPIVWIQPDDAGERRALDERCRHVGRPLVTGPRALEPAPTRRLVVATWNMHDGRGDLIALVDTLRQGSIDRPGPDGVIVLLQEVVRSISPQSGSALQTSATPRGMSEVKDVPSLIARLGWHFAYLPARRNRGRPAEAGAADRGVAILSSLPLSHLEAIELPVERQRRLALSAMVSGRGPDGRPRPLKVVSVHLENRAGARRLWARAAASRTRQTEALLDALTLSPSEAANPSVPLVVGGDFNTWLSHREHALDLLRARFATWPDEDDRPTMSAHPWRIDYLFPRLPASARTTHRRLDSRYGSDHYPVVAEIDFGPT